MRLALLSDIHGNLIALQAVLEDVARRGVDTIVNLGDSLSGPLLPRETAAFLMAQPWVQLSGNHERQLVDFSPEKRGPSDRYAHAQLDAPVFQWMAGLKPAQRLTDDVFLCHGTPESDLEYFLETIERDRVRPATREEIDDRLGDVHAAVVACGHTHVPRVVRARGGCLVVNPGSVGLQAYEDGHPIPHVVQNGSPDARYAIVERRAAGWSAELIAVPYDHAAASRLAAQHDRPDWARALLHGYL
ncbi:MAG TPA: metallophosphoesterase family protein [Burkholderiales bacterium]|nr:metallophosphoesterase family protein [Burkholderiales bacterium]